MSSSPPTKRTKRTPTTRHGNVALSDDEKVALTQYFRAVIIAGTKGTLRIPNASSPNSIEDHLPKFFHDIFEDAKRSPSMDQIHPGLKRGYALAKALISNGKSDWSKIKEDVQKAVPHRSKFMDNGLVRNAIFSKMSIADIQTVLPAKLTEEDRLDLLMQMNDGSSQPFRNMLDMARDMQQTKELKRLIQIHTPRIQFDINTRDPSGNTLLLASLSVEKPITKPHLELIKTIFHLGADPRIPCTSTGGSMKTAFSYAVYKYGLDPLKNSAYWDIIEWILQKYKLKDLYLTTHPYVYGMIQDEYGVRTTINNVYIARTFPIHQIQELFAHGLDLTKAGDDHSADVEEGINHYHEHILKETIRRLKQKLTEIPAKIETLKQKAMEKYEQDAVSRERKVRKEHERITTALTNKHLTPADQRRIIQEVTEMSLRVIEPSNTPNKFQEEAHQLSLFKIGLEHRIYKLEMEQIRAMDFADSERKTFLKKHTGGKRRM